MMRKYVSATVSAALCLASLTPAAALAQEYRFAGFDAPRGATATVNLRVPFGPEAQGRRPTVGITAALGQESAPTVLGESRTRAIRVADLRFDREGLASARLTGYDLVNPAQNQLNIEPGKSKGKLVYTLIGFLVLGGLALCIFEICDDDGNSSSNNSGISN